jgi:hypothetical protein
MRGFPVRLDGPSQVALFAYDNNTFIVESYLPTETDVTVSVAGEFSPFRTAGAGRTRNRAGNTTSGPGWYRRELNLTPETGKRYFVRFEAAGSEAEVYLNGERCWGTTSRRVRRLRL